MIDLERAKINLELIGLRLRFVVLTLVQVAAFGVLVYGVWGIAQYIVAIPEQPSIAYVPVLSPDPLVQNGLIILAGAILIGITTR